MSFAFQGWKAPRRERAIDDGGPTGADAELRAGSPAGLIFRIALDGACGIAIVTAPNAPGVS